MVKEGYYAETVEEPFNNQCSKMKCPRKSEKNQIYNFQCIIAEWHLW